MPGAPHYSEAFSRLPGRCFRMVAHHGEAGPIDRPESMAWRGSWRASNGRRYRVEACEGHRPPPLKVAERTSEGLRVDLIGLREDPFHGGVLPIPPPPRPGALAEVGSPGRG